MNCDIINDQFVNKTKASKIEPTSSKKLPVESILGERNSITNCSFVQIFEFVQTLCGIFIFGQSLPMRNEYTINQIVILLLWFCYYT